MRPLNRTIKCRVFWDAETTIRKAKNRVEGAKSAKEKKYYAQDILLEAGKLLSCLNYSFKNLDCLNCRTIAHKHIKEYESLAKNGAKTE